MFSKRNSILFIFLLILGVVLAGCSGGDGDNGGNGGDGEGQIASGPTDEITVFSQRDSIDPEVYSMFDEEFEIIISDETFTSNELLHARLQGGTTDYSLVVPSNYYVSVMIQQGLLAKLDHGNIPNLKNLDDRFRDIPYDLGNQYCVPYQWGTIGIVYDATVITPPQSWSVLFNPDPTAAAYGRVTMLDDSRAAFATALIYLGYNANSTEDVELAAAKQLLVQAKFGLSGYNNDTFDQLVATGHSVFAHGWNDDFRIAQEENFNLTYAVPQEGSVIWTNNLCIPVTASPNEKLTAEMFINFLLRPDVGAMLSRYTNSATPNKAAEEFLDRSFLADPTIYPPNDMLSKLQYIVPVGTAESTYQRLWDEVKAAP